MIKHWEYDDGMPYFFETLNKYSDKRLPGWRCHLTGKMIEKDVEDWFVENCEGDFEIVFRFNSGSPYLDVRINNEADAIAFLLRWSGNE